MIEGYYDMNAMLTRLKEVLKRNVAVISITVPTTIGAGVVTGISWTEIAQACVFVLIMMLFLVLCVDTYKEQRRDDRDKPQ